jgi:uncharacterized membrane protein
MAKAEAARANRIGSRVREISTDDVQQALTDGWRDVLAAGPFSLFFGAVYAVAGLVLIWLALRGGGTHLVFPLLSGFLLVGPVTAVGLYEVSRRLQAGEPLRWGGVATAFMRHGGFQIALLGFVLAFIGLAWFKVATILYAIFYGATPLSFDALVDSVTTTFDGLRFALVGNAVGALMAVTVFAISVVSVPMLLDRDVDAVTAMLTSVEAVRASPRAFISFGLMVVTLVGIGMALFMVGLVVTLPLIGHATWHVYRRAVV